MDRFACWMVRRDGDAVRGGVEWLADADLPLVDGPSVTIDVAFSSFNYKDALACGGHPGVAPKLPHVPGIDCAGTVAASDNPRYGVGEAVLVTGYDLGGRHWGGFSGRVRVPADWVVPTPGGLTPREAMLLGTAGFTAAQCVMAIESRVAPDAGDVLVTGATGGVGVTAVAILAKLGYRVVAVTGKPERADALRELGAAEVVPRDAITDDTDRPMLSARWAAAVDTVGGKPLVDVIRATAHRGVVAACGLVAGSDLPLSVHPFILRGVTLAGIDSAKCPRGPREEVWRRLAGPWRAPLPEAWVTEITLDGVAERAERLLAGGVAGRTLVIPTTA
ncbi:MAG: YhdH/YhfP family quinone oxidoreductase [Planctomycetota bacterium]